MVPRASWRPANTVSLPLSAENMPVESTVKANTEATTTKAMRIMAVSSPVTPLASAIGPTIDGFFSPKGMVNEWFMFKSSGLTYWTGKAVREARYEVRRKASSFMH
jgi:hypothetical protein